MILKRKDGWEKGLSIVTPAKVLERIEPGMRIFLGTGVAEPRTLVSHLMDPDSGPAQDLELIQLVSIGETISLKALATNRYRLKTFFSGWPASDAITAGRVDLIPSRFSEIPRLIESGRIAIDAAFIQITPPDEAGYCSLGMSVDVTRAAMEQAELVVGEINDQLPVIFGDTFVHLSEFDMLVRSTESPMYYPRWQVDEVFDQIAEHVAAVIRDGSCLAFTVGSVYEALGRRLSGRRNLGIHSPFFTDALMDLVKSGAVTNRAKGIFRGKSVATYAVGTPELMTWLDRNPLIEFQSLDKVIAPTQIGKNPGFMGILSARKADISGSIALHKGFVPAGPGDAIDLMHGAEISPGGLRIFTMPSRNREGKPNILLSVANYPNQLSVRESVDMIVTEYGIASLNGRTVRERAQALIEIAHPDDRRELFEGAREKNILYADQIFLEESTRFYPTEITAQHSFKDGLAVRFRAIRPSDEEDMRRLFYRFSDQAVYYRYFSPIKTMPHAQMQKYVNVDYRHVMSLVGLVGEPGKGLIIAEARYVQEPQRPIADVAFVVDEEYQGHGIATFLYRMLVRLARERGVQRLTADVLASNKAMMMVFEKAGLPFSARLEEGVYALTIPLEDCCEEDPSSP
ncbi:MAG: GCN5 family acetyltransferase [Deltaproteobacteria bacterium SG8_13]|nr:MAG: GCN5 family acetyltransferase [Deltaproteobacteria bacterium SG8_13]